MPVLTLTTDFGLKDGFVGAMKGVIWNICPQAQIADLSHGISPQNVLEGALTLQRACSFFPAGTVHIAVVDPGVGTERRPLAAHLGAYYFVAPDNGLLTPIIEEAEKNGEPVEFVQADNPTYWLPDVSHTFHGRDIFAPLGAHLAKGVPLADLGPAIHDPARLALPRPEKIPTGWRAHVIAVDTFGNCATDLPAAFVISPKNILFRLHGREIRGLSASYGHHQTGELIALVNSENYIEVAVVNSNAAQVLGVKTGDIIEVILTS